MAGSCRVGTGNKKALKSSNFRAFFYLRFAFAVRTGLEPATPCVTGMYSNQLNYHTKMFVCIERPLLFSIASANVECFFEPANVLLQKNECLKFFR